MTIVKGVTLFGDIKKFTVPSGNSSISKMYTTEKRKNSSLWFLKHASSEVQSDSRLPKGFNLNSYRILLAELDRLNLGDHQPKTRLLKNKNRLDLLVKQVPLFKSLTSLSKAGEFTSHLEKQQFLQQLAAVLVEAIHTGAYDLHAWGNLGIDRSGNLVRLDYDHDGIFVDADMKNISYVISYKDLESLPFLDYLSGKYRPLCWLDQIKEKNESRGMYSKPVYLVSTRDSIFRDILTDSDKHFNIRMSVETILLQKYIEPDDVLKRMLLKYIPNMVDRDIVYKLRFYRKIDLFIESAQSTTLFWQLFDDEFISNCVVEAKLARYQVFCTDSKNTLFSRTDVPVLRAEMMARTQAHRIFYMLHNFDDDAIILRCVQALIKGEANSFARFLENDAEVAKSLTILNADLKSYMLYKKEMSQYTCDPLSVRFSEITTDHIKLLKQRITTLSKESNGESASKTTSSPHMQFMRMIDTTSETDNDRRRCSLM